MIFSLSSTDALDCSGCNWLIVGLGNPGRKYAGTRHNIGFRVIDRFAEEESISLDRLKFQALSGQRQGRNTLILAKPMTFMNLSGEAVYGLLTNNKIDIQHLIVLHDDVDFLLGTVRIKIGGGAGGHKGIKSIIDRLGKNDFIRVRVGVGRPYGRGDLSDYVLSRFEQEEKEQVEEVVAEAGNIVRSILEFGVDNTMNRLHNKDS